MKKSMKITLKAGERIYINGAVLRCDRKVSVELLNDVTFLLEHHVMKPEDTSTPLRQLYFIVQTMIMDPARDNPAQAMCESMLRDLMRSFTNEEIRAGLENISDLISRERSFEALREIRSLLPIELRVMASGSTSPEIQEAADGSWRDGKQFPDHSGERAAGA